MKLMKSQILWQYSDILHLDTVREIYIIEIKWSEEKKKGMVGNLLHQKANFQEVMRFFRNTTKQTSQNQGHKEWAIK